MTDQSTVSNSSADGKTSDYDVPLDKRELESTDFGHALRNFKSVEESESSFTMMVYHSVRLLFKQWIRKVYLYYGWRRGYDILQPVPWWLPWSQDSIPWYLLVITESGSMSTLESSLSGDLLHGHFLSGRRSWLLDSISCSQICGWWFVKHALH